MTVLQNTRSGHVNPLLALRGTATQASFARRLGCSATTIQFAEKGCYSSPPIPYRRLLSASSYKEYRLFQLTKRQTNFSPSDFPPAVNNLPDLLTHLRLTPYQFAEKICIQPGEVFRLLNVPARRLHIPSNLIEAFTQIGCDPTWIRKFSNAELVGEE